MPAIDYKQIDDKTLVGLLLKDDDQAWEYILLTVAMRIVQQRKFSEMLRRKSHEPYEAISQLIIELKGKDNNFERLKTFEFKGSFDGWLYWEVKRAVEIVVYGTKRKEDNRMVFVDPQSPTAPSEYIASSDSSSGEAAPTSARNGIEAQNWKDWQESAFAIKDSIRAKKESRAQLWREDPESAYALLMADECQLDYKHIATLLNRPHNTIAQKISRARKRLKELEQK